MKFDTSILFIALTVATTTTEAAIRGSTTSSSASSSNNRRRVRDGSLSRYDGLTNAIDASSLNKIRGRFLQVQQGGAAGVPQQMGGAGVGAGDKPQQQQMNSVNDNQAGGPGGANDAPGATGPSNDEPNRQDKNEDGGNAKNEGGGGNAMDKNEDGDKTKENVDDKNDSAPDDMTVEIAVDGSMSMTIDDDGSMSMSMGY